MATKRTAGASQPVTDSYNTLFDGFSDDVGQAALPLRTETPRLGCYQLIIQNDPANVNNMLVGTVTSQSIVVTPGQSYTLPYQGYISEIYVRFVAGIANQRVNWHAMG